MTNPPSDVNQTRECDETSLMMDNSNYTETPKESNTKNETHTSKEGLSNGDVEKNPTDNKGNDLSEEGLPNGGAKENPTDNKGYAIHCLGQTLTLKGQHIFNVIIAFVVLGLVLGLVISASVNTHKMPSKQYLMCELNRDKLSTTQDGPVVLPWNIQKDQKYGDIQVVNDTVIIVPVEGVYDIQVTLHEEIPKDMPQLAIMTVTFEGEKGIFEGYKRLIEGSGVDKPMTMNFSLRRLLRANQKIWIKRNLAQYNRIKQPSGTLTIIKIN